MLNDCHFIGRLGRDVETTFLPAGDMVAKFSIAIDESYKKAGEKVQKTEWINIVAFKKLTEICGQYLHKGSLVYVSGKMQTRKWQDKEGVTKYATEIIANSMQMLDSKKVPVSSEVSERGDYAPPACPDDDIPF